MESSDREDDDVSNKEKTSDDGDLRVTNQRESDGEAKWSPNVISRASSPTTMRLMALIEKVEAHMLVDSRFSHNFVSANTIKKVGLGAVVIEPFDVRMANSEKLKCDVVVRDVKMNM